MEERFTLLYEKYNESIKRHIYYIVFDKEVANDITHDVYLKLFSAMKRGLYKEYGLAKPFLYTLATNLSLNYLDCKHYTKSVVVKNKDIHLQLAKDECDVHSEYCSKETLERVLEIIGELSDKNVEVFYLRYFENFKFKEIAKMKKMPLNTVKSCLTFCDLVLKRKGFEFVKNKKSNQAKLRKERNRKRKLVRGIA